ncbi:MAG TPA: hypothetical protein VN673_15625, partial [Clostridia bacterium]|nr:hypothetical protein [Clostridia bacterium]
MASAGFHVLLMVILFVGPAFLSSKQEPPPEVIDFVPSVLLDGLVPAGGGNPNAAPPPAQPVQPAPAPAPAPAPQPEPEPEPEPPKPAPKAKAPEPEPVKTPPEVNQDRVDPDAIAEAKPKKPAVSLKVHTAKNSSRSKAAAEAKAAQQ